MTWERARYDQARAHAYTTSATTQGEGVVINSHIALVAPTVQPILRCEARWRVGPDGGLLLELTGERATGPPPATGDYGCGGLAVLSQGSGPLTTATGPAPAHHRIGPRAAPTVPSRSRREGHHRPRPGAGRAPAPRPGPGAHPVIVVSYGSTALLERNLADVARQAPEATIVVVDNLSTPAAAGS